ncbi:MAG: hypothetical protein KIT25_23320 [Enhydrobacter sp.]|nr:MAG: hypothetical protein KIT25_23320 [Enhydrobacter sp.]
MLVRWLVGVLVVLSPATGLAMDRIEITRGADDIVYGNCVPSLDVENNTLDIIDYLQVDLVLALRDGRERLVELRSAYRDGILHPIGAGGRATLRQHLDMSRALGVSCSDVTARRVVRMVCEAEGGKSCVTSMSVRP